MEEETIRVRMPRGKEMLGTVVEMLGASRFRIHGNDGKERICRIPGSFKRKVMVKIGDVIIFKPWDIQPDERGDIIWRYRPAQVGWLIKHEMLKQS
jgi:translation initiation factor 1A